MKKNTNLHSAKRVKNDEFYTQFEDVNLEVDNYREVFLDKNVYLNCDSVKSEFYRYFKIRFKFLKLKTLTATHFDDNGEAYKLEYDGSTEKKTKLNANGDFRSPECIEILSQCDIVVTNPPFSLFREFVSLMVDFNKDFLIVGSMNAITYKDVFGLIKDSKLWLGINSIKKFLQPDGSFKSFGNICWFTNIPHRKRNEEIILAKQYNEVEYPKYDDYDVIEVSKVAHIPKDYEGIMGVPITFLSKYNPDQFEILGIANSARWIGFECYTYLNRDKVYNRIIIKRKQG